MKVDWKKDGHSDTFASIMPFVYISEGWDTRYKPEKKSGHVFTVFYGNKTYHSKGVYDNTELAQTVAQGFVQTLVDVFLENLKKGEMK